MFLDLTIKLVMTLKLMSQASCMLFARRDMEGMAFWGNLSHHIQYPILRM